MENPIFSFEIAMRRAGLEPGEIRADRTFRRCYVQGDRRGTKNGWYILNNEADRFWGVYGSNKTGERYTWAGQGATSFRTERPVAPPSARASLPLATIWANASDPDPNHKYLITKHVSGEGLRQSGHQLLVPYRDINGKLAALGTIKPDGSKRFMSGSKPRGAFMLLGEIGDRVLICEGYATAAACHSATQAATVVAGSAENLVTVACALRERYPGLLIVFMADDDHECEVNKGRQAANEAAATVNGIAVIPSEFYSVRGRNDGLQ